jgi:hypothetical protein
MIVKVQRPLIGSPDNDGILVYDEYRRHSVLLDPDALPDWLTAALTDNPKIFANAKWAQGKWKFNKLAKWQHW